MGNTLVAHPRLMQAPLAVASGLVDLDRNGEAVVTLPKGLGELHSAFRYQLTPVGGPAPNLHIAQQVRGGKFKIAGGTSRLKVSWQIAGELKDRRLGIEHTPEAPFDKKMAQEYKRHSKEFTRRVEEIKARTPRLSKRR